MIVAPDAWRSNGVAQSRATNEATAMTNTKTCAACDYPLDENAIQVRIGGQTVEVCCEDCAKKLNEAYASANATTTG
ncbi:hypothetical protein LYSHEL_06730 [Lysobacter helvus]|uniref:TRASH domain-containing protein n=3 Tax=Lysobacterales TaxID=135614 RepID=A0ABM7Q343_9GAMM|nr:hypothetical protein LYSCAS_06730 [Lysobacter caseinilyticus]BCT94802.1 hypothetical protein LYSHEL_06730 [Lysobacter helvus]